MKANSTKMNTARAMGATVEVMAVRAKPNEMDMARVMGVTVEVMASPKEMDTARAMMAMTRGTNPLKAAIAVMEDLRS